MLKAFPIKPIEYSLQRLILYQQGNVQNFIQTAQSVQDSIEEKIDLNGHS